MHTYLSIDTHEKSKDDKGYKTETKVEKGKKERRKKGETSGLKD